MFKKQETKKVSEEEQKKITELIKLYSDTLEFIQVQKTRLITGGKFWDSIEGIRIKTKMLEFEACVLNDYSGIVYHLKKAKKGK